MNFDELNDRYLCFKLGKEEFAIPLLAVKEVIALPRITPVPQSPAYFLGIMNLRGQVISVIDLRSRLGVQPTPGQENAVIICDLQPNSIGVLVDSIDSVISPPRESIREKPDVQGSAASAYITAVFQQDERLVLLLDVARALSSADLQMMARNGAA
jgi:purine-binding chemotaxis protein CheW